MLPPTFLSRPAPLIHPLLLSPSPLPFVHRPIPLRRAPGRCSIHYHDCHGRCHGRCGSGLQAGRGAAARVAGCEQRGRIYTSTDPWERGYWGSHLMEEGKTMWDGVVCLVGGVKAKGRRRSKARMSVWRVQLVGRGGAVGINEVASLHPASRPSPLAHLSVQDRTYARFNGGGHLQSSCQCSSAIPSYDRRTSLHARGGPRDGAVEEGRVSEPKWKQKLAAADENTERIRQLSQQAEEEYKRKQSILLKQQPSVIGEVLALKDLEFVPYLDEEGMIINCSSPDAKASVYAVFDQDKVLQYIGVSRQVYMSMRLHFARMPSECWYVKVQHITRPSRSLLELIRDKWIAENGSCPNGNDNGSQQNIWENPLDCKPLMTEKELRDFNEAGPGPPKAKVLKNVARRVEAKLEGCFHSRNCKEKLRFDPKLKDRGLLDLKNAKVEPDKSVPSTNIKAASAR